MFMNRSDRSVTSKIDLELKRLRGEQSDPYPQLNPLRERVYGLKAVERVANNDDGVEDEEGEDADEESDESSSNRNKSTDGNDIEEDDESVVDKDDEDYREEEEDYENEKFHENANTNTNDNHDDAKPEDNHKTRHTKRLKAAAVAKRQQKRLRKLRLETRSRVKRLLAIGTDMTEEPSRAWLGDRVYDELQAVESLFRQLQEEQRLLVEYSRSVAGELRLVKQWLEL